MVEPLRFPIRIGRRSRPVVRLWTATPETAYAEIGDDLEIRFGRIRFRTPIANLARWRIEGPFVWIRAIGIRRSLSGGDVSFAGAAHGGVRVDLVEPVRWGPFRVPAVWVGADDLEGFSAELARRGIPGVDARRGPA
ncbi:MAG TPA: hypothetical protein VFO78_09800 [Candidatus Limnocylindrales bacterium]|nr:hypothetical protein [Candidatus Limnocylindrales bacterium]